MVTREMSESKDNLEKDLTLNVEADQPKVDDAAEIKPAQEEAEAVVNNQVENQEVDATEEPVAFRYLMSKLERRIILPVAARLSRSLFSVATLASCVALSSL